MALHYWIAPCRLENLWKLKVPRNLVLLPKMDLFFLVTMEKQWVFNTVTCKILPHLFCFLLYPKLLRGYLSQGHLALQWDVGGSRYLCHFSLGMSHLDVPGWEQGSQDGPEDLNSQLCNAVERAWNLVRKRDRNPCSAIYWSWEGCFSPLGLSFPIYETERVIPSVCLPTARVWEDQMRWVWSFFRCSLPLPHQAGAHPHPCAWECGLWLQWALGKLPHEESKREFATWLIFSASLQDRSAINIAGFRVQLVLGL